MIQITSNRDGHTGDRGTSFASATPNTYTIKRDGEVVGSIEQIPNFPLRDIDPAFAGRGLVWVAYEDGDRVAVNQSFRAIKEIVKNHS